MGNYNNLQERCSREVLLFVICSPGRGRGAGGLTLADKCSEPVSRVSLELPQLDVVCVPRGAEEKSRLLLPVTTGSIPV